MAHAHFGNLADLFKHVALAQVLARLRPAEYWESHAGSACYDETNPVPAERAHGIYQFVRSAESNSGLRALDYFRVLDKAEEPARVIGSPLLARRILGDKARRFLLCDTDAGSLQSIQKYLRSAGRGMRELSNEELECVQDDGISVLRGAGMLLPEAWHGSTLVFVDPCDLTATTEAGITPLELACELANRSIAVLVFVTFANEAERGAREVAIRAGLAKARLTSHAVLLEGNLNLPAEPKPPTQWGFGMLALNLGPEVLQGMLEALKMLETAYGSATIQTAGGEVSGAWSCRRAVLG